MQSLFSTLSVAFLFLVPLGMGALTVALAPPMWRNSWWYASLMPIINVAAWTFVVAVVLWLEVFVCVIMALPIVLVAGLIGGVVMLLILKGVRGRRGRAAVVTFFVGLPYLVAPIEALWPVADSFHMVETSVVINAPPEVIWRNIVRVPAIQPAERDFRWFNTLGFPWPVEAQLDFDGPGGQRYARYSNGLTFEEPITDWQPGHTYAFDIHPFNVAQLQAPFNQIGGPAFTPLNARYVLEPLSDGRVNVRLISTHRLTTRFNAYGGWWTEWLMADLQHHILHVIQIRAEARR
jgi:hypothetical protein